jgi:type II secretory pathway pseudopilin PulG
MTGRRDESGVALLEILIAVVILSFGFTAIIGAINASIVASDVHRQLAATETVARDYAEAVKQKAINTTAVNPHKCPTGADLTPATPALPKKPDGSPSVTIDLPLTVEWWIPNGLQTGSWGTYADCTSYYLAVCGPTDTRSECDPGLQRVTIGIRSLYTGTRNAVTQTQVVLRRGNS